MQDVGVLLYCYIKRKVNDNRIIWETNGVIVCVVFSSIYFQTELVILWNLNCLTFVFDYDGSSNFHEITIMLK